MDKLKGRWNGMGMMMSFDDTMEFLKELEPLIKKEDAEKYSCAINRLNYENDKAKAISPKLVKFSKSYRDYYTCAKCLRKVDVIDNYCPNCGKEIKWDSTRCLTGK